MKRLLFLPLALAMGCQDHHFVPMDKADNLKLPGQAAEGEASPHSFEETEPAKKEVMAREERKSERPLVASPIIAEGSIELGEKYKDKDFTGYSIFVIARMVADKNPLIAVEKYSEAKFPMEFKLDEKNLMAGNFPPLDSRLRVEVWLDKDGDVISRSEGDLFGYAERPFIPGEKNIRVVLNHSR